MKSITEETLKDMLINIITKDSCGVLCLAKYACPLKCKCNNFKKANSKEAWGALRRETAISLFIKVFGRGELLKVLL